MTDLNIQTNRDLGLIFPPGPENWWDSERVSCPRVLRCADGVWRMWYYGRDPEFDRLINLPTGRCGLATSHDGLSWTRVRGPLSKGAVFEPAKNPKRFDSGHVGVSHVEQRGDMYWMWYFGGNQDVQKLGPVETKGINLRPGCAISRDGVNWLRLDGQHDHAFLALGAPGQFDAFACGWPQVKQTKSGEWLMYYHSLDLSRGFIIGLAESEDGLIWNKAGEVLGPGQEGDFDEGGAATRDILETSDGFLMFYEGVSKDGHRSIGLARSDDGRTWHKETGKDRDGSVFSHAPSGSGRWDAFAVGGPCIVEMEDGCNRMYYIGSNEVEGGNPLDELGLKHQIGLAVSEPSDPTIWHRWM